MNVPAQVYVQRLSAGPLELREVRLPRPAGHQVAVRMRATGLCQSQVYWMDRHDQQPMLHGHEGFGVVTEIGDDVTDVAVDDAVVLSWIPRIAATGRRPIAATVDFGDFVASSHNVHTWATHTVVDELYVAPLPDAAARPESAVLGCAVLTGAGAVRNSAGMRAGDTVGVIGLGGVGLSSVAAARYLGAATVVAVDVDDDKLAFATKFGASATVNSRTTDLSDALRDYRSATGAQGFDVVIDCVGARQTVADALACLVPGQIGGNRGGTAVLVGAPKEPLAVDGADLLMNEKSLVGCRGGGVRQEEIGEFIEWFLDDRLPLETMVTDRYQFDALPEAVERLRRGEILGRSLVLMDQPAGP